MTINTYNDKFIGGAHHNQDGGGALQYTSLYEAGGDDGDGGGTCAGQVTFNQYKNSCYNMTGGYLNCTGGSNQITADPLIIGEQTATIPSLLGPTGFYGGTSFNNLLYLQNGSPLIGAGSISGVPYTNGSTNDVNGFPANSPISIGAVQYNSCIVDQDFCSISGQCCGGICNSEGTCGTGSCTSNGGSCLVGANCCSGICCSNICESSCSPGNVLK